MNINESMNFSYLASLDEESFEAERNRLIANALIAIPVQYRSECIALQQQITEHRVTHTALEHMVYLGERIAENLANLADAANAMNHIIGNTPTILPANER